MIFSLAACSSTPDRDEDPFGTNATQTYDDWNYEFEKCMKSEGFDLADGVPMNMGDASPSTAPRLDPQFEASQNRCFEKVGQAPALPDAPSDAEIEAEMLAFAKCMRELGYDYADPTFTGDGGPMVQSFDASVVDPDDVDACSRNANPSLAGENSQELAE